jgi:uncharacterized protein (TIGR00725 family)
VTLRRRPATERPYRIAVVGAGKATEVEHALAHEVGGAIGRAGAILVCGGLGGVMEAAARGAREAGGLTIGILPGPSSQAANDWISVPLATGMGEARNALVVRSAEAVIAVGGGWGTLSEIALARKMGLEVATLGTPPGALGLPSMPSGADAVRWALERAEVCRKGGQ